MPELPEVETVCRQLREQTKTLGAVTKLHLFRPDLRWPIPKNLPQKLRDQKVHDVTRRGKYILFHLPKGYLLSHLGMTGSWRFEKNLKEFRKHDHLFLQFENGQQLVFHDPRRFGVLDWADSPETHELLKDLGPEPLSEQLTENYLWQNTRKRQVPIKSWLMNNNNVVGIGNIYASEILFLSKIKPLRKAAQLKQTEVPTLLTSIRQVLQAAIDHGGSTIRDYVSSDGEAGSYQDNHQVYERDGEPCRVCLTAISVKALSGRSTYWCKTCQK